MITQDLTICSPMDNNRLGARPAPLNYPHRWDWNSEWTNKGSCAMTERGAEHKLYYCIMYILALSSEDLRHRHLFCAILRCVAHEGGMPEKVRCTQVLVTTYTWDLPTVKQGNVVAVGRTTTIRMINRRTFLHTRKQISQTLSNTASTTSK